MPVSKLLPGRPGVHKGNAAIGRSLSRPRDSFLGPRVEYDMSFLTAGR
jgi:hypothetical protein